MRISLMRAFILSTIEENQPITITELAEKINLSKGTSIYRYLRELESKGLIVMGKEKNNQKRKKGNPVFIRTTSKSKPFKSSELKKTIDLSERLKSVIR